LTREWRRAILAGAALRPGNRKRRTRDRSRWPVGVGGKKHMGTTTKKDLIDLIAAQTNQKRTIVKKTVHAFLEAVIRELGDGNRLEFRDFGVFEVRERAPRVAQNPKTLERVKVPPRRTVKFKIGRLMKMTLDGHGHNGGHEDDVEIDLGEELALTASAPSGRRKH